MAHKSKLNQWILYPYKSAKRLIKTKFKKQYIEWISTKSKDQSWVNVVKTPGLIPDLPRKEAVVKFRLLTGHDCLTQHLNKIGIKESPNCTLCHQQNVAMNGSHLSKFKPYKGYCGEILGCKKENDVIVNSSAFETNQPTNHIFWGIYCGICGFGNEKRKKNLIFRNNI